MSLWRRREKENSQCQQKLNKSLSEAILGQQQDVVPRLVEKGADVNRAEGHLSGSPLYLAARDPEKMTAKYGNRYTTTIINCLLEHGADPNVAEEGNDTPLLQALLHRNSDAAMAMIAKGARVNARSDGGNTPLVLAARMGNADIAQKILDRGADINTADAGGDIPLTAAARGGSKAVVKLLLEYEADVNAKTSVGLTALMAAATAEHVEVVEFLLENGADMNAVDGKGNSVLHLVAEKGLVRLVRLLLNAGADAQILNADMKSPADLAEPEFHGVAQLIRNPAGKARGMASSGKAGATPLPDGGWILTAPDEVARVAVKGAVGYRITELFNFTARTYTHIASNLASSAESQSVKAFSELDSDALVELAHAELLRQGGTAGYESAVIKKLPVPGGPAA